PDAIVSLMSGNALRQANRVYFKDSTTLFVTFNLVGLTPGPYDVRVVDRSRPATLPGAFTVDAGTRGRLEVGIVSPRAIRPGRGDVVTVSYFNTGETDIPAPLLTVVSHNATLDVRWGAAGG